MAISDTRDPPLATTAGTAPPWYTAVAASSDPAGRPAQAGAMTGAQALAEAAELIVSRLPGLASLPTNVLKGSQGPKLLLTGVAASQYVAKYLPTANAITVPSNFGPVELRPGAIWSGDRMLVYAGWSIVHYTVKDVLYEWSTPAFVRDEWLDVYPLVAAQTQAIVCLAKIEVAFLSGLLVPWYVLLGVSAAGLGLTIKNRSSEVKLALEQAPRLITLLKILREQYPTLFSKLMTTAAREVISNLPSGVTSEDVAFFLGRLFKGVGGLPEVTLGAILSTAARVAAIVAATHLPAVTAEAIKIAAHERAEVLQADLAKVGIVVTKQDAEIIMHEVLSDPNAVKRLEELEGLCQELIPTLEQLSEALHRLHR
jgi:hypothetical protein